MASDLRSMRDVARAKKRPRKLSPQSWDERAEELEERSKSVLAFPFKRSYGDRYADESKRLAERLGIRVTGLPDKPGQRELNRERAVYAAIGQAIHSLPSLVWPWLEQHGRNITFEVTPNGAITMPGAGIGQQVAGYYIPGREYRRLPRGGKHRTPGREVSTSTINVGAPSEEERYWVDTFRPRGQESSRKQTIDYVRRVAIHEFAHWIDWQSDEVSQRHPELFGNVTNPSAPHDARQWERFAYAVADYLDEGGRRANLDKNIVRFLDRFIGPYLSYDNKQPVRRPMSHRDRQQKLVKRVAAIKTLYSRGELFGDALEVERKLKRIESIFFGDQKDYD